MSIFLGWWLMHSYTEQKRLLAAETSQPFFRSVNALQDSLIMRRFIRPFEDSTRASKKNHIPSREPRADTVVQVFRNRDIVIQTKDTIIHRHHPPMDMRDEDYNDYPRPRRSNLFARIMPSILGKLSHDTLHFAPDQIQDSLRIKELGERFKLELDSSKIAVDARIIRLHEPAHRSLDSLHTASYQAGLPPRDFYVAYLINYQGLLFKRLLPQILFSVFLLGLTSAAFIVVFRSLKQQQRLTELKNDFISNVSHELKTPISTVNVAIEALANFDALKDPNRTKEYLAISKMELSRLNLLVDKVLRTALFDQQRQVYHFEILDVSLLVDEIIHSLKFQFEKNQADVQFEKIGTNFNLSVDRVHFMNVLYNLIDNALKYSNGRPVIQIILEDQGNFLYLSVQDEGIGIAPHYQQQIFEKFFRVPTGNVHNIKGHGLGLSYVNQIVLSHAGKITLHSEIGKGSTFDLIFSR
ncbi:MAG: HAMP domain-containing sensor histidine kinase [Siphonobacter sp.]